MAAVVFACLTACGGGGGGVSEADAVVDPATGVAAPEPAAPAPAPEASAQPLTIERMSEDMNVEHEALAHGVPSHWSWGTKPRVGRGHRIPEGWTAPAFVPWGIAATAQSGNPAKNVRVQIRKVTADIKRRGSWERIVDAGADALRGALYTNYETNANAPADMRAEEEGFSVKLPEDGGSFHFMTRERVPIERDGIEGVVVTVEARLIVDDPSLPDDRDQARLLVLAGGDYWRSMSANWNPREYSNDDAAVGRFRFATAEWKRFTSHSLMSAEEIAEYLEIAPTLEAR